MIRLYDTLTRQKRDFVPQDPKRITMYVCGPTVYGRAHIGNARPPVVFDVLARLIRHEFGPDSLIYARNVTDVDDKIIAAAKDEGAAPSLITKRYERFYVEDMSALGVEPPSVAPHATLEIAAMIAMIERLIGLDHAYETQGHVLFSVASDPDYGLLSRRDRNAMIAGARVEVAPYKRDPADFVLWKPSSEGVIGWDSPWGRGRPGWHIECSAMIANHLGETIDIHGGGLDLIFPHHENEIAQSRCAHGGAPLARYWVHNGFVDMGSEKMSKSLGNIVTPSDLMVQGHRGETLRLALLTAHYRQPLPWTDALIAQAKNILDRWYRAKLILEQLGAAPTAPDERALVALCDDLNTPAAIAAIGAGLADALSHSGDEEERVLGHAQRALAAANLMGLLTSPADDWLKGRHLSLGSSHAQAMLSTDRRPALVPDEQSIKRLIAERSDAKKRRDFATADRIREELKADGIILEDGSGGTSWRRE